MCAHRLRRQHYVAQFHLAGLSQRHADRRTEMLWVADVEQRQPGWAREGISALDAPAVSSTFPFADSVNAFRNRNNSAEAIRVAAQKGESGLAMANQAAELRLRAERKAGRLLLRVRDGGDFGRVLQDLDLAETTTRAGASENCRGRVRGLPPRDDRRK